MFDEQSFCYVNEAFFFVTISEEKKWKYLESEMKWARNSLLKCTVKLSWSSAINFLKAVWSNYRISDWFDWPVLWWCYVEWRYLNHLASRTDNGECGLKSNEPKHLKLLPKCVRSTDNGVCQQKYFFLLKFLKTKTLCGYLVAPACYNVWKLLPLFIHCKNTNLTVAISLDNSNQNCVFCSYSYVMLFCSSNENWDFFFSVW